MYKRKQYFIYVHRSKQQTSRVSSSMLEITGKYKSRHRFFSFFFSFHSILSISPLSLFYQLPISNCNSQYNNIIQTHVVDMRNHA